MSRAVGFLLSISVAFAADPKPLPLQFVDTAKNDTTFTWPQIDAGTANLPVWNGESTPRKFEATVTPFLADRKPGSITVKVMPVNGSVKQRSLFQLQFSVSPDPAPGEYTGFLILSDPAKKLTALKRQIHISIPNPDPLVSKLTATFTRVLPWSQSFLSRDIELPVHPGPALNGPPRVIGALHGSQGGWTLVRWNNARLEIDPPPQAGTYDGDVRLTDDAKNAVTLSVMVQDCVIWPIVTILLGIGLAFLAKRYIGVTRVVWGLRQQAAEAGEQYKTAQGIFASGARGRTFAGDSIQNAVGTKRTEIEAAIERLAGSWSTSIEPANTDFVAATGGLKDLSAAVSIWSGLANVLRSLEVALDQLRAGVQRLKVHPASASKVPAFLPVARALLEPDADILLANVATLNENAAANTALTKAWLSAADDLSGMTEELEGLMLPEKPSQDQTTKYTAAETALERAWRELLAVGSKADLDGVTGIGHSMGQARNALDEIKQLLRQAKTLPPQVGGIYFSGALRDDLEKGGEGGEVRLSDGRKVELLRRAIKAGDTGAVLFSTFLALLTGLNTLYFGKPFGTVQDYVSVFLWAAATKATLDIIAGILDKLSVVARLNVGGPSA
jgi:hypothetical protein